MPGNSFSMMEGYALYILLTAPSDFASNLNVQIKQNGATIASVNAFFLNAVAAAPLSLGGQVDISKIQALWTDNFGDLALQLDQTPIDVMQALTPAIPYTSPPCPKPGDQNLILAQLRK